MDAHGLRYIMNYNTQIIARKDKNTVRRMITAISRISSTKNYPFISWNWRGQDQANILKTGTLRGGKHVLSLEIFWMNKTINEILLLFLSLDMVIWNLASGGFAYIWQSKWVGMIAIKTERTQIHFLSDVLVVVASFNLKVPI